MLLKRRKGALSLACIISIGSSSLLAAELEAIVVEAEKIVMPTKQSGETVYTGSEVTSKGIELQGTRGSGNAFESIRTLPGVNVESADDSGLNAEQSNMRVRGVSGSFAAMSIEGIPSYGLGPIGGRDYIFDMHNMESVAVYKGGVPSDIGSGVGNRGGAIVLRPKWAGEVFGFDVVQTVGGNSFTKSYFRLDSGKINASGTRFSGAVSYAKADKWRGEGELGPRKNVNLSLVQPVGEDGLLKVLYNRNDHEQHSYRALSYSQIQTDYKTDFGTNPAQNSYYKYNKSSFVNDDLIAVFSYDLSEKYSLHVKPYFSKEDSLNSYAQGSGTIVQQRVRDIERYGAIVEVGVALESMKATVGYHYENINANVVSNNYNAATGSLVFQNVAGIAAAGTSHVHSPFVKFAGEQGDLKWQAGVKYFEFQDSDVRDISDPDANRVGRDYTLWLPTLGLSYDISSQWEVYGNYGKNFIRPYSYAPLVNYYKANKAKFEAIGMSAQNLFDGYTTEESNTIDMGVRYRGDMVEVSPTFFAGKHKNLLVTVINPQDTSLLYNQNAGKATSYGVETEINLYLNDATTVFVTPTYTVFTYDNDIRGSSTKKNQVVDVPKWMGHAGVVYKFGNFELVPMVRYLGERYGNATNTEKIEDVWLTDLKATYTKKNFYKKSTLCVSLDIYNMFDKKYVSIINASDDTLTPFGTAYYQGSPRSAMLSFGISY